jgi:hypothetical protein
VKRERAFPEGDALSAFLGRKQDGSGDIKTKET